MSVLLLRLAGPLQAWGDSSRFTRRTSRPEPTKSGILGLIAAAQGRRRSDPVEDLTRLRYGVRTDQPGELVRDFHTAHAADGTSMPLSYRYYLADAVFVAGLEADRQLLEGIDEAIRSPRFPLYLGRRSCPPEGLLSLGLRDGALGDVLRAEPWHASVGHQKRHRHPDARLPFVRDALPGEEGDEIVRDLPRSFDPERREYDWRAVVREPDVEVVNAHAAPGAKRVERHDPMRALEAD